MTERMAFTTNRLDRDSEKRTESSLAAALAESTVTVCLMAGSEWLVSGPEQAPDPRFGAADAPGLGADLSHAILLGRTDDGTAVVAAPAASPADGGAVRAVSLRALAMAGTLDPDLEGQLAQAQHLFHWNRRTRFCGVCSGPTVGEAGGYRRRCTACGELFFPRTDPVVIMLVHDGGERCILGRQPNFAPGMYSALAGFVEPGETLEDAVRREVLEEAGITVGAVRYHASQPWPFPGSLMIGCLAQATQDTIRHDTTELEDCRWFTRQEARAMLDATHPDGISAPRPYAIAHHLLRAFVEAG